MGAESCRRLQMTPSGGSTRRQVLRGMGLLAGATVFGGLGAWASSAAADGDLVAYTTNTTEVQNRVVKGFTATTGIGVQSVRLTSAQLARRFAAEQQAGRESADIIAIGDDSIMKDLAKNGMLRTITGVAGYSAVPGSWNPQENFVLYTQGPRGFRGAAWSGRVVVPCGFR